MKSTFLIIFIGALFFVDQTCANESPTYQDTVAWLQMHAGGSGWVEADHCIFEDEIHVGNGVFLTRTIDMRRISSSMKIEGAWVMLQCAKGDKCMERRGANDGIVISSLVVDAVEFNAPVEKAQRALSHLATLCGATSVKEDLF